MMENLINFHYMKKDGNKKNNLKNIYNYLHYITNINF